MIRRNKTINNMWVEKEGLVDFACDVFADIINEVIDHNKSDLPYIKEFRKRLEEYVGSV